MSGPGRLILTLGIVLAAALPTAVRAAPPTFGRGTIEATFGTAIVLTQPVSLDTPLRRVELLLSTSDTNPPLIIEVPTPTGTGAQTLRYTLDVAGSGHILPNTPITARWRLTPADGAAPVTSPAVSALYADKRFTWRTLAGDLVRVHWYEGDEAFGARALKIGEQAVKATETLLGVTEDKPVDFFVYADQTSFYDALGPGTRENVGGQSNADIRTLFALITPSEINAAWVGTVVPHELVHLVFDTAVHNPYHFPPRWLNEGLAVYQSQGYAPDDRSAVRAAAGDGSLIPLDGLVGQFPTTRDGFFLAYAESVSAVDYLIRTYHQEALVKLIRSYATGRTDEEAFRAALGIGIAEFGDAWLADLGADPPIKRGPQPAPDGPRPPSWTGAAPQSASSAAPVSSAWPGQSSGVTAPSGVPGRTDGDGSGTPIVVAGAAIALLAAGSLVVARRRRRPMSGSPSSADIRPLSTPGTWGDSPDEAHPPHPPHPPATG